MFTCHSKLPQPSCLLFSKGRIKHSPESLTKPQMLLQIYGYCCSQQSCPVQHWQRHSERAQPASTATPACSQTTNPANASNVMRDRSSHGDCKYVFIYFFYYYYFLLNKGLCTLSQVRVQILGFPQTSCGLYV